MLLLEHAEVNLFPARMHPCLIVSSFKSAGTLIDVKLQLFPAVSHGLWMAYFVLTYACLRVNQDMYTVFTVICE